MIEKANICKVNNCHVTILCKFILTIHRFWCILKIMTWAAKTQE